MNGRVVFIGAGPGAADLITLRGAQRLAQAEVETVEERMLMLAPEASSVRSMPGCGWSGMGAPGDSLRSIGTSVGEWIVIAVWALGSLAIVTLGFVGAKFAAAGKLNNFRSRMKY